MALMRAVREQPVYAEDLELLTTAQRTMLERVMDDDNHAQSGG